MKDQTVLNMVPKYSRLLGPLQDNECPNCGSNSVYLVDPPNNKEEGCWLICVSCLCQSGKEPTQYAASQKWRSAH